MNGPGMSIFNGGGSIHVDQTAQELEDEEEELEDRRRRTEELHNQLQNAFDDLNDEDDSIDDSMVSNNVNQINGETKFFQHHGIHHQKNQPALRESQQQQTTPNLLEENFKLKTMFESKQREFDHVSKLILEERKSAESQLNELRKRLSVTEAEKERAIMTRTQTHELLVESKAKISDMTDTIDKLKGKINTLETKNTNLQTELDHTRTMLSESQQKFDLVERNLGFASDRNVDAIMKQVNERHNGQIELMQQQIENYRVRLDETETELKSLDIRYKDLQRSRESLLVEKGETINNLVKSLEDSQRQCQMMIGKPELTQENIKLKRLVQALEQQTDDMQKTINNLTHKLESTGAELEIMDSVLCNNDASMTLRRLSQSAGKRNISGSTPLSTDDRLIKLKTELFQCMNGQKMKREEIKRLEEQLKLKDEKIERIKIDENKALVELHVYKDETTKLSNKLRLVEKDLERVKLERTFGNKEKSGIEENEQIIKKLEEKNRQLESTLMERENELKNLRFEFEGMKNKHEIVMMEKENITDTLNKLQSDESAKGDDGLELEKVKFLLKDSQNELDRVKNLYIEMSNAKDLINRELNELKSSDTIMELSITKERNISLERSLQLCTVKCSELQKLIEKEKLEHNRVIVDLREKFSKLNDSKNTSNTCPKCVDCITDIAKCEIQNIQLQNSCANYLKEINDLKLEIQRANQTIAELHEKLELKMERDNLLDELKAKAQQFEEMIRSRNTSVSKSVSTSPPQRPQSRDQSSATSPELQAQMSSRENEKKIRQEMAKSFAQQIKNVEDKFKEEMQRYEKRSFELNEQVEIISSDLKVKINEVHLLKHTILTERAEQIKILKKKDDEIRSLMGREKKSNDRELFERKIHQLTEMLDEKNEVINSERTSMVAVMNQWTNERKQMKDEMTALTKKIQDIQDENVIAVKQLYEKYQSAKKTAINYKNYSEDKEKHMLNEYNRIKEGYNTALEKVQNKMKSVMENQQKITNEKIAKIESEYENRIKSLQR